MTGNQPAVDGLQGYVQKSCADVDDAVGALVQDVGVQRLLLDQVRLQLDELLAEIFAEPGQMYVVASQEIEDARDEEDRVRTSVVDPGMGRIAKQLSELACNPNLLVQMKAFDLLRHQSRAESVKQSHEMYMAAMNRYSGYIGGLSSKLRSLEKWWEECE